MPDLADDEGFVSNDWRGQQTSSDNAFPSRGGTSHIRHNSYGDHSKGGMRPSNGSYGGKDQDDNRNWKNQADVEVKPPMHTY